MNESTVTFKNIFLALFFMLLGTLTCLGTIKYTARDAATNADIFRLEGPTPQPEVREMLVSRGKKLKDVDWHCYAGGGCELWLLTRARAPEDKPETYVYQNGDGTRIYVIKEQ